MTATEASPISALRPGVLADAIPGARVRDAALVIGGAGFVGLAAQLSIPLPFTPVPISGQTFAVLLAGAALGWRRGLASMVLYLVAGVAGLPWFAGGASGSAAPSFGFVVGFVAAAAIVGRLARAGADRTPLRTIGLMALGSAVIYLFGVPWLAASLHVGAGRAIALGLTPFLIGDAVKAVIAAGLLPGAWRLVRRAESRDA
jgi:biotin transport system substrate-specific component